MMIASSPIAPMSAAGVIPAATATSATAATAFTLTLQSIAQSSDSALAAPLLAAGGTGETPHPPALTLLAAMPEDAAGAVPQPATGTVVPAVVPGIEFAEAAFAAPSTAQATDLEQTAPATREPIAAAAEVSVDGLIRATPVAEPASHSGPPSKAETSANANASAHPLLVERPTAEAQTVETLVETSGKKPAKTAPRGEAQRTPAAADVAASEQTALETTIVSEAAPALVPADLAGEPIRREATQASEQQLIEAQALPAEVLPEPAASLLGQQIAQRPADSRGDSPLPDTAIKAASPKLTVVSAGGEGNAPVAAMPAAAAPADAAVFSIALDGQAPAGPTEAQGLPSPLLGQTIAPAASRPLSAQHIYPAQATPVPGTVTAQPGRIGREMGVEIARRVSAGQDEMLIRLNPQEMGRIEVRLSFDESGAVRAILASESPAALEMLRRDTGDLARSLADAGVRSDGQSFRFDRSGGDGAGQRGHGGGNGQQGRQDHGLAYQSGADEEPDATAYRQLRSSGQVNLIA